MNEEECKAVVENSEEQTVEGGHGELTPLEQCISADPICNWVLVDLTVDHRYGNLNIWT